MNPITRTEDEINREVLKSSRCKSYEWVLIALSISSRSYMTRSVGCLQLFESMRQRGVQPNAAIYSAMASVFARCGNLERSIEVASYSPQNYQR